MKLIRLVASFLLDKWILNSLFVNLKMEGLIKDFNLPRNCFQNLKLMSKITFSLMTRQEWEVQTPEEERADYMEDDLFRFSEKRT